MRNEAIERQKDFRKKLEDLKIASILHSDEFKLSDPTKICFKVDGLEGTFVRQ